MVTIEKGQGQGGVVNALRMSRVGKGNSNYREGERGGGYVNDLRPSGVGKGNGIKQEGGRGVM